MTKRNYFQSLVIFLAAGYFIKHVFNLNWFETLLLLLLTIICVIHTMDVRDDFERKKEKRKYDNRRRERSRERFSN